MKRFLFLSSLFLCFTSCKPTVIQLPYESEIYFEYENLITGETGTITAFDQVRTQMTSYAGNPGDELPETFRQAIQVIYQSEDPEEQYPHFTLNLYPTMVSALVKPIDGQAFGQLYTYRDSEDYLREAFPLGNLLSGNTSFDFIYAPSYVESARANSVELADSATGSFYVSDHAVFFDQHQVPSLFIKLDFSGTLRNDAFGPFSLQEHFRITNGQLSFTLPVDNL